MIRKVSDDKNNSTPFLDDLGNTKDNNVHAYVYMNIPLIYSKQYRNTSSYLLAVINFNVLATKLETIGT